MRDGVEVERTVGWLRSDWQRITGIDTLGDDLPVIERRHQRGAGLVLPLLRPVGEADEAVALRAHDPRWGVRDLRDVQELARLRTEKDSFRS